MPTTGDVLLLAKLGRAVGSSNNYTTETKLAADGRGSTGTETKMSHFDAGTVASMTLNPDEGNSATTTGTMNFTSPGILFISRIAARFQNFTWTESSDDYNLLTIAVNQDCTATITIANNFPGYDTITITGKFHEAGFSDGFNDHVTGYNTNKSDNYAYGPEEI
jgi:hypothetical protein